jgi:hypothetical protein
VSRTSGRDQALRDTQPFVDLEVDHLVRADLHEHLMVDLRGGPGEDVGDPAFFQDGRGEDTRLDAVPDRDDADIRVLERRLEKRGLVRRVQEDRYGRRVPDFLHQVLVLVYGDHRSALFMKGLAHAAAEGTQSDDHEYP